MHNLLNKILYKIRYVICSSRVMLDRNSQNLYLNPFWLCLQMVEDVDTFINYVYHKLCDVNLCVWVCAGVDIVFYY